MFGLADAATINASLAVEMVHCYSLIHDDLPAMDDDDLRRGLPTVHKAYDDATAILAGDALLTHAFGLLAAETAHPDPAVRARLVLELASGAGAGGKVGGQMRDIEGETSFLTQRHRPDAGHEDRRPDPRLGPPRRPSRRRVGRAADAAHRLRRSRRPRLPTR